MRKSDRTNPYAGLPGFWNRWNWLTYNFSGAAQVGVGRGVTEAAAPPPANPVCPMCGRPMADHRIERTPGQTRPTRLHCPA